MSILKNFINGKNKSCNPVWFMRQAGRYLPEFRKIRLKNPDFIKLCLNSDLSSEITLQPIKRFNLDAAIIFSDILIVPYGLGQTVVFKKDLGPVLSSFNIDKFSEIRKIKFSKKLQPVYDAISKTRLKLDKKKSLIGFVGAPWTLVIYMLGLKNEKNKLNRKKFKKIEINIINILKKLTEYLKIHINNQIEAGVDVIQIFDSWASLVPEEQISNYCYKPNLNLVEFCKKKKIPVICFPKGIKKKYEDFVKIVKPDVINIDYNLDPFWARDNLGKICIQGGMNPKILFEENKKIVSEASKYLEAFKDRPYIFNLGHGLLPQTNPTKIKNLIKFIKEKNK